jgi:hypothetical protein
MRTVAVLTGDLIQSRHLENGELERILEELPRCFEEIKKKFLPKGAYIEFYRGDSFQVLLNEPELALRVALLLRARLRSLFQTNLPIKGKVEVKCDARIAIGIGSIRMQNNQVVKSQGEAFELSGMELDRMGKENKCLSIRTVWGNINQELGVSCLFADSTINNWSAKTAESVYRYLLYENTQKELADYFKISQPAVRKRLKVQGNMRAMDAFISRFYKIIQEQINTLQNGL